MPVRHATPARELPSGGCTRGTIRRGTARRSPWRFGSPLPVSHGGSKSTESRQMYPEPFAGGRAHTICGKRWLHGPCIRFSRFRFFAVCMLVYIVWSSFKNSGRPAGSAELEFKVDRREGNLRVNWNQSARLVQRAQGAVLTIRDAVGGPRGP
jgi:hypothetical protein